MAKKYIDADRLKQTIADNVYPVQDAFNSRDYGMFWTGGIEKAIDEQPAVDIPRWIPVTERLPEEAFGCLVTVWDTDPISMDEFENLLPYFVGWDGEQWNDGDGEQCPFEVIAWMPLPAPCKGGEEE